MFSFFNKKVFNQGYLPKQEGHEVFFQEIGNPNGKVVLHFHGGPGGKSSIRQANNYNLKKQRIILFDQRGSGLSKSEDITNLNDTKRLIKDAKRLLEYLNINTKISVGGGSWGTTLALLFAEKYPELIENIYLYSIFLARREDMEWMLKHSGLFYPDLLEEIKHQSEGENPYTYYAKLIFSDNLGSIQRAIKYMVHYEYQMGKLSPKFEEPRIDNEVIASSRIYLYYAANRYFLEENEILKNIDAIKDIPTLIVHNRLDMCCPLQGAWSLYRALNNATIDIVSDIGHSTPKLRKAFRSHF